MHSPALLTALAICVIALVLLAFILGVLHLMQVHADRGMKERQAAMSRQNIIMKTNSLVHDETVRGGNSR
ncbi:hypothetical protein JT27_18210 [Alcaligenes faecalis]|nr:hypothetical protein JT27_18210 [Alcaligenes faecalis]